MYFQIVPKKLSNGNDQSVSACGRSIASGCFQVRPLLEGQSEAGLAIGTCVLYCYCSTWYYVLLIFGGQSVAGLVMRQLFPQPE